MATIPQFFSGPMTTIDYVHDKTHEGRYFSGGYYNSSLANGANQDIVVTTSANNTFHAELLVSVSGESTLQIYENATYTGGTDVTMSNHNRSSSKTSDLVVKHTPTITGTGSQLNGTKFIAAGDKHTNGVIFGSANEYVLAKSKTYLVRLTNISGSSARVSINLIGYHPEL